MYASTTIIGLIILALFIIPVFLISKSKKKKSEQLKNDLMNEAKKAGITIADTDHWNDSVLGIDDKEETIIYIDESRNEKEIHVFNMNEVKSVKFFPDITNEKSKIDYNKEPKLCITLFFKESAKAEVNLTFFTANFGNLSKHEQNLFEKWVDKIKKLH